MVASCRSASAGKSGANPWSIISCLAAAARWNSSWGIRERVEHGDARVGLFDQPVPQRAWVGIENGCGIAGKNIPTAKLHFVAELRGAPAGITKVDVEGARRDGRCQRLG